MVKEIIDRPMVDVIMTAYNHERCIDAAILSVLNQKASFRFRLIISDDSSADSTRLICEYYSKRYSENIVFLRGDRNIGVVANYQKCFSIVSAKYISILEGDDYWTNMSKLQDQVDILEANPSAGLVHTKYDILLDDCGRLKHPPVLLSIKSMLVQGKIFDNLTRLNFICPLTVLFRSAVLKEVDFDYMLLHRYQAVDYHLWLAVSLRYNVVFINKSYGVYRVSNGSISNTRNIEKKAEFDKTRINTLKYFNALVPIEGRIQEAADDMYTTRAVRSVMENINRSTLSGLLKMRPASVVRIALRKLLFSI